MVYNVFKPTGLTPLQTIQELKNIYPALISHKMTYAGRLDPLAYGVLIILSGTDIKDKEHYLNLDKTYKFSILLGIQTDSYDLLGIIKKCRVNSNIQNLESKVNKFINQKKGYSEQCYPPYSSKTVSGKPLFQWVKDNMIDNISIPSHQVNIKDLQLLDVKKINIKYLKNNYLNRIRKVSGDFRQLEISKSWTSFIDTYSDKDCTILNFKLDCSSGTYVRSLVNEFGLYINSAAVAIDIFRTKVGIYDQKDSIKIL